MVAERTPRSVWLLPGRTRPPLRTDPQLGQPAAGSAERSTRFRTTGDPQRQARPPRGGQVPRPFGARQPPPLRVFGARHLAGSFDKPRSGSTLLRLARGHLPHPRSHCFPAPRLPQNLAGSSRRRLGSPKRTAQGCSRSGRHQPPGLPQDERSHGHLARRLGSGRNQRRFFSGAGPDQPGPAGTPRTFFRRISCSTTACARRS